MRLDALVRERHGVSWGQARKWIATRKIWLGGEPVTDPGLELPPDAALELRMNAPRAEPRPGLAPGEVVHVDAQLVVLDKPAGLSTVPHAGEGPDGAGATDDSLAERLHRHLGGAPPRVVHRLDRETSGLIVFARTEAAARHLEAQFRRHSVHRRYLALAHGDVAAKTIRSALVEDRGDGRRGSIDPARAGGRPVTDAKPAVTHVAPLERHAGFTLIECRLETGRTHQIRIHLSEAGHPLLGDRLYCAGCPGEPLAAPRLMLHAAELGFVHPTREAPVRWTADPPADFLARLRLSPRG